MVSCRLIAIARQSNQKYHHTIETLDFITALLYKTIIVIAETARERKKKMGSLFTFNSAENT